MAHPLVWRTCVVHGCFFTCLLATTPEILAHCHLLQSKKEAAFYCWSISCVGLRSILGGGASRLVVGGGCMDLFLLSGHPILPILRFQVDECIVYPDTPHDHCQVLGLQGTNCHHQSHSGNPLCWGLPGFHGPFWASYLLKPPRTHFVTCSLRVGIWYL